MGVLLHELGLAYSGSPLHPRGDYREYVAWTRRQWAGNLPYWESNLDGAPRNLDPFPGGRWRSGCAARSSSSTWATRNRCAQGGPARGDHVHGARHGVVGGAHAGEWAHRHRAADTRTRKSKTRLGSAHRMSGAVDAAARRHLRRSGLPGSAGAGAKGRPGRAGPPVPPVRHVLRTAIRAPRSCGWRTGPGRRTCPAWCRNSSICPGRWTRSGRRPTAGRICRRPNWPWWSSRTGR